MKITSALNTLMFTTAGSDWTNVSESVRKPREILISFTRRRNRATRNASPNPASRRDGIAKSRNPTSATTKSTLYMKLDQYIFHPIAATSRHASRT